MANRMLPVGAIALGREMVLADRAAAQARAAGHYDLVAAWEAYREQIATWRYALLRGAPVAVGWCRQCHHVSDWSGRTTCPVCAWAPEDAA